ncbi:OLC1v1022603C1 [Oldenlandia corymbosa var. corymbosa]|uniref:OLC1v1022603C1 n=1 Tax=Oldenlandia corymbosa var. corymbosa TaxID=529605 RepID=A0AAV1C112_OLDCO|nr:OLC1v1022603C1 [Oldenlandia corymbosa var. corymbosa]
MEMVPKSQTPPPRQPPESSSSSNNASWVAYGYPVTYTIPTDAAVLPARTGGRRTSAASASRYSVSTNRLPLGSECTFGYKMCSGIMSLILIAFLFFLFGSMMNAIGRNAYTVGVNIGSFSVSNMNISNNQFSANWSIGLNITNSQPQVCQGLVYAVNVSVFYPNSIPDLLLVTDGNHRAVQDTAVNQTSVYLRPVSWLVGLDGSGGDLMNQDASVDGVMEFDIRLSLTFESASATNQSKTYPFEVIFLDCKGIKCMADKQHIDEERISKLPDEILSRILSYLPLKEAGRTSILSKRWKRVWTLAPDLDFNGFTTLCKSLTGEGYNDRMIRERPKFVNFRKDVSRLSCFFSKLKSLSLFLGWRQAREVEGSLPQLPALKELCIELCLAGKESMCRLTTFFRASPNLEKLVIKTLYPRKIVTRRESDNVVNYPLQHLRVIEMSQCRGRSIEFELVKYLLKNAISLEITVDPRHKMASFGNNDWLRDSGILDEQAASRDQIIRLREQQSLGIRPPFGGEDWFCDPETLNQEAQITDEARRCAEQQLLGIMPPHVTLQIL